MWEWIIPYVIVLLMSLATGECWMCESAGSAGSAGSSSSIGGGGGMGGPGGSDADEDANAALSNAAAEAAAAAEAISPSTSPSTPETFNMMRSPTAFLGDPARAHFNMNTPAMQVFNVLAGLVPGGNLAAKGIAALVGNQPTGDVFSAISGQPTAATMGMADATTAAATSLGGGGPAEMTPTSFEAAFAPGGAVANAVGVPAPGTTTSGTPTSTQRANAGARGIGGISPDFLSNLKLLESLT